MIKLPQEKFPPNYELLNKIGRGGTSDIYLARMDGRNNPVVLKLFYSEAGADLAQKEINCAARLNFPGIARVLAQDRTSDNDYFLVMEYCPGPLLEQFAGHLKETEFLSLLSAITVSLQVIHQNGIIHNDLKPANIFCPLNFGTDRFDYSSGYYLKLIDFSLADFVGNKNRSKPTGTVGYMSPEMITKEATGPASDLFSLGVIAYYMACGNLPFISGQNDPLEINNQVLEADRPSLTGQGAEYSQATAALINSLMAVEQKDRPVSAFALLEQLARLGSPYPFRSAIRPRHLLPVKTGEKLGAKTVLDLFGASSFSEAQLKHLKTATAFDRATVRILLEHNYEAGNFARLDGRWGWKNQHPTAIEWSRRLSLFALRPLRKKPISLYKLAIAQAVIGQAEFENKAAVILHSDRDEALAGWKRIPACRTAGLIYSLNQLISKRTRKSLSISLAGQFTDNLGQAGLAGKLLSQAERYQDAVKYLLIAIDKADGSDDKELIENYFSVAETAAENGGGIKITSDVLIRKGVYLKEIGQSDQSEAAYYSVIDLYDDEDDKDVVATAYKGLSDLYKSTSDYTAGINALNRAMAIYTESGERLGLSNCLNNQGNMYWVAGKFDLALTKYQEALTIQRELKSEKNIASTLTNIGSILVVKGRYEDSLKYFRESLQLKEKLGDKGEIARSWNNLGVTYYYMGQSDEAVSAFEQSMVLNRATGSRIEQLFNLENMAEVMVQSGRLNDALTYVGDGAKLAENIGDAPHGSIFARITERLQRRMGYFPEAEKSLKQALKLARQAGNQALELPCLIDQSRLALAMKDLIGTAQPLQQATEIAQESGDNNALFHISLLRYEIDNDQKHLDEAGSILEKLQSGREAALLQLTELEKNNRDKNLDQSESLIVSTSRYFSEARHDIDMARFKIACGLYYQLCNREIEAKEALTGALELARIQNLQPEMWQSANLLSEILFGTGDFEKSYHYARMAADRLKNIASRIEKVDRLQRFYNDKRIIELLGRIKSLKSVLTK